IDGEAIGVDLGLGTDSAQPSLFEFGDGGPAEREVTMDLAPTEEEEEQVIEA
ncbi:MAG: hypothetical protein GWN89_07690, partial [Thermoplasmata archaeon]|nr:hypothetical protein [Thermoplasmata archaeon]